MMASKTTTTTKKKKATEKKPTWWWKSDDDWVEYDAKLSARLEKGYQSGESEVKVDDERFVDLENFLQRRYDDRMKRRGVKRVPPPILDEMVVWLILPAKLKKEHVTLIEEHGGLIASNLNKGVTHVVCRQRDVEKQKQQLLQARKWKCKLVDEQYLNSCTEKLAILPINDHKLDLGEDEEEEEEEEEEEAEASSSTSKKRKMDIVNDNGGSSSSSTASTSASSQEPKLKKAKSDAATSIPSPADIYLQPSCVFSG
ncbi:WWE domain containing protein, partial [Balamuthia mandrillaris]